MNHTELLAKIKEKFEVTEAKEDLGVLNANVNAKDLKKVIVFLKEELKFNHMPFLTALDFPENNNIEAIYSLYSYETKGEAVIRVKLGRDKPVIDSVSSVFLTADWHERETGEMFGITFTGHPDPSKLLLPDDIDAPLRKDFKHEDFEPLPKV